MMENNDVGIPPNATYSAPQERPTPEKNTFKLAKFRQRMIAFIIDMLIVFVFDLALNSFLLPAGMPFKTTPNTLFLGFTASVYFMFMTRYFGQTLGKKALGLIVVRADGLPLDWETVVTRELFGKVVSQLHLFFLGYLACLFSRKKQCWHDWFADTYVVESPMKPNEFIILPVSETE